MRLVRDTVLMYWFQSLIIGERVMFKTANVGNIDRVIRVLVGAILIALPFVTQVLQNETLKLVAPIVGVVLIVTALVRFCPLYRLIGASTCKTS